MILSFQFVGGDWGLCIQLLNGCEWMQRVLVISMVHSYSPFGISYGTLKQQCVGMCFSSICSGGGGISFTRVLAFFHWFCVPWSPPGWRSWLHSWSFSIFPAPENRPGPTRKFMFQPSFFRGYPKRNFGEVTIYILTIQFEKNHWTELLDAGSHDAGEEQNTKQTTTSC